MHETLCRSRRTQGSHDVCVRPATCAFAAPSLRTFGSSQREDHVGCGRRDTASKHEQVQRSQHGNNTMLPIGIQQQITAWPVTLPTGHSSHGVCASRSVSAWGVRFTNEWAPPFPLFKIDTPSIGSKWRGCKQKAQQMHVRAQFHAVEKVHMQHRHLPFPPGNRCTVLPRRASFRIQRDTACTAWSGRHRDRTCLLRTARTVQAARPWTSQPRSLHT